MAESVRSIAARRGYMAIRIRERGNVPRRMKKAFNAASKQAWADTAEHFHAHMRDKRFTPEHAAKAGYAARRGERLAQSTRNFRRSYYGRKLLNPNRGGGKGRANPLEFTGATRRAVKSVRITSTSKRGRAAYAGARTFNFRHPRSRVRMDQEFRRIIPEEAIELGNVYDRQLDRYLSEDNLEI